ncbi:MAG: hypothetical protein AAFN12_04030 [Cyanobacteria bacterium J06560_2]
MASPPVSTTAQAPSFAKSSFWPLALYWTVGAVVGALYLRPEMAQIPTYSSRSHFVSVAVALAVTVVTTVAYSKVTTYGGRSLHLPTLFGFSLFNGILETVLFLASFKIGTTLAVPFTAEPLWLFLAGTLSFFVYSGIIHVFFWLKILPPHLNKSLAVQNARRVWIVGLVAVSVLWGWLYFAYQDFWSVAALHALFDAGMVYCIRYRLG